MNYLDNLLELAIIASINAGKEIIKIYNSEDFFVEKKKDYSPLTIADRKANQIIETNLLSTDIPILSEEGRDFSYEERKSWENFWLVDPLDGTKEFIKRNGEFTVNIALIEKQRPSLGVIFIPVNNELYFSSSERGTFFCEDVLNSIATNNLNILTEFLKNSVKLPGPVFDRPFTVVGSRSHMSVETETYIKSLKEKHSDLEVFFKGSSLKLCMVAHGLAEEYPRFAPTMEWDTGAGQAIVEHSGGCVLDYNTNKPLLYNKENLLNPWFYVKSKEQVKKI